MQDASKHKLFFKCLIPNSFQPQYGTIVILKYTIHENSKYTIKNVLKHKRKSNKEDGMKYLFKQDMSLPQGKAGSLTIF